MSVAELCLPPPSQLTFETQPTINQSSPDSEPDDEELISNIIKPNATAARREKIMNTAEKLLSERKKKQDSMSLADIVELSNIQMYIQIQENLLAKGETNVAKPASLQVASLQQARMRRLKGKENWQGVA